MHTFCMIWLLIQCTKEANVFCLIFHADYVFEGLFLLGFYAVYQFDLISIYIWMSGCIAFVHLNKAKSYVRACMWYYQQILRISNTHHNQKMGDVLNIYIVYIYCISICVFLSTWENINKCIAWQLIAKFWQENLMIYLIYVIYGEALD